MDLLGILVTLICCISTAQSQNLTKEGLTSQEIEALGELRILQKDHLKDADDPEYYNTDTFLLRWLRAKKMDPVAADKMIRDMTQWRKDNSLGSILNETILTFKNPPYKIKGVDKEGRPILLMTPMGNDLRKFILSGKRERVLRCFIQMLERAFWVSRNGITKLKNGDPVTQYVAIMDVYGFSIQQHLCIQCPAVYLEMIQIYENYYPGSLKHLVFVNTMRIAIHAVEGIQPFMTEQTINAVKVFGPDKKEWTQYLQTIISKDQLPYRFGGTMPGV
jgi:hypothetical protein